MNIFEAVKQSVTTWQAAESYGIRVNKNGMAVCPFHRDKNPSMKVDRRFHCFGCQADGDVIDFTAHLYNLKPKEAAEKLARDFSIHYENMGHSPPQRKQIKRQLTQEQRKVCSLMLFKEALDNPYVKPKKAETDRICEIMNTSIVGWKQGTMTRFKDYGTQRSWVCVNENCKRDAKDLKNENDWHPVTEEEARQMELSFQ